MSRFWSYDGDTWNVHDTAAGARGRCDGALELYREDAPDGWAEEVESIMWGQIVERVVETERVEHLPDCRGEDGCHEECPVGSPEFGWRSNYALRPVTRPPDNSLRMRQSVTGLIANVIEELGSDEYGYRFSLAQLGRNLRELRDRCRAGDIDVIDEFFDLYVFDGDGR